MIIDLQFTTPAWKAVIPTSHLTFTALQKILAFTPPLPILIPGSWLREGKLLREWPQQEAEERRVRTDWVQGVSSEVVTGEGDVSDPPPRVDLGPITPAAGGACHPLGFSWLVPTDSAATKLPEKDPKSPEIFVINFPRTRLPHEGYSSDLITWP